MLLCGRLSSLPMPKDLKWQARSLPHKPLKLRSILFAHLFHRFVSRYHDHYDLSAHALFAVGID